MTQAKSTVFALSSVLNVKKYTDNVVDFMTTRHAQYLNADRKKVFHLSET